MMETERDDSGVATIIVVLAMTAVVVGAALAIDVGGYVAAARSAQNSADATVLAVATDCALTGAPIADYSPYRKDGQTITTPACGDGESTITVTKDVDGLLLAQSAGDVNRSATARWGALSQANTVPLVIAKCEFDKFPIDERSDIIVHLPDTKRSTGCSSGPGGFGQLDEESPCSVTITAALTASGKPGNDVFKVIPCITNPDPTKSALPYDVLIPVYNDAACPDKFCQGNGDYPIAGFAAFHITGYSFGPRSDGTLGRNSCDRDIGKNCIRGDFIRFLVPKGTTGDAPDFGAYKVYLYK